MCVAARHRLSADADPITAVLVDRQIPVIERRDTFGHITIRVRAIQQLKVQVDRAAPRATEHVVVVAVDLCREV
ncbi:Uncharacterised protein [Mycobacteroides abscessus subsp. abscessus]|nr:Uncharacterised protein [Mycobacteroides abscessus subsp. abscessus]